MASSLGGLLVAALCIAVYAAPARGEDSDQVRYYLGLRLGEKIPGASKATDIAGGTVGVNLGRTVGFELALDEFELKVAGLSELSVLGIIPQVRLRYPLLRDRLTPYAVGGAGLSVTQPNDARAPVSWPEGKTATHAVASLGGGVEYFFADNLAAGLEGKYLFSGDVPYAGTDTAGSVGLSTWLFSLGVRVFYPQLHPAEDAAAASARVYLNARSGVALLLHDEPFAGVRATPEQPVFDSELGPMFGVAVGADLGRFASVELLVENYELTLDSPTLGRLGEYAVFPITVRPRFRYPMLAGRLEPYLLGGVGVELGQLNDKSEAGRQVQIDAHDTTVVGTVGAGIDYRLISNVAVGCGAEYVISRGHTLEMGNATDHGNFDVLLFSIGLRIFLVDL